MRMQIELSDEQVKQIEDLEKQLGINTHKELFLSSVALLMFAVREKKQGNRTCSVNKNGAVAKEFLLPILEFLKEN